MSELLNIIRSDFWAAAVVFAVCLAALSFVVYLFCESVGGGQ